jgi:antitoxin (DNA-binding transcriptional repressor) of toxin-antitoxin stability system
VDPGTRGDDEPALGHRPGLTDRARRRAAGSSGLEVTRADSEDPRGGSLEDVDAREVAEARIAMGATGSYFFGMRAVGIKVLKNRLSEFVRLAASGETILITDRDRVVAELAPPREGRSPALDDAKLADMVRAGLLKPPLLRGLGPPPSDPILPFDELMSDLGRSREDR